MATREMKVLSDGESGGEVEGRGGECGGEGRGGRSVEERKESVEERKESVEGGEGRKESVEGRGGEEGECGGEGRGQITTSLVMPPQTTSHMSSSCWVPFRSTLHWEGSTRESSSTSEET